MLEMPNPNSANHPSTPNSSNLSDTVHNPEIIHRPKLSPTQRAAREARIALQQSIRQAATIIPIRQPEPVSVPVEIKSTPRHERFRGINHRIQQARISLRMLRAELEKLAVEYGCAEEADGGEPLRGPTIPPTVIIRAAAEHYGLTTSDIRSLRRRKQLSRARQVAMYLLCELTEHHLVTIGKCVNRDHTTVLYGVAKMRKLMGSDPTLRMDVQAIRAVLARYEPSGDAA